jgi:hypothetical protein
MSTAARLAEMSKNPDFDMHEEYWLCDQSHLNSPVAFVRVFAHMQTAFSD